MPSVFIQPNNVFKLPPPNKWKAKVICVSICTQNNYQQVFRILFQRKI